MLKKLPVLILCASPLLISSNALAVSTGVELSSVDIPMDGATISIPGLEQLEIKKSSECNPEEEECPDAGYDYYFSTDVPLYGYDMGTAIIETKDGLSASTFTNQPFGSLTLSPVITDNSGNITGWIDPLGDEYKLEYDDLGRISSSTNGTGNTTKYEYDGVSRSTDTSLEDDDPIKLNENGGVSVRIGYDSLDRPSRITSPTGETTSYEYDSLNRIISETNAGGTRSEINYYPENSEYRISNFRGTSIYQYDTMGRIGQLTKPRGEITDYQYDNFGRSVIRASDDGAGTRSYYDLAGNLLSESAYTLTWSPYDPVDIGPKSKVGTESVGSKVAKAAAGKVIGSLFGGFGGGSKAKKPKTKRDPARRADKSELYDEETDTKLEIRPNWVDDKLHVSVNIKDSDDKATFQYIYLVDEGGNILGPEHVELYKIWVKHTLTVSWTESVYQDGALISQTSGGWTESWVQDLGTFRVGQNPLSNIPGIWQTFGYDRAHAGARTVGATFNIDPATFDRSGPLNLVVHVSRPKLDPVSTIPFIGQLFRNGDDDFEVEPIFFVQPTLVTPEEAED